MSDEAKMDKLITKLKEDVLFDEALNVDADTEFKTLDAWDSLAVMGFISVISESFGVEISFQEMETLSTIREVNAHINGGGS